MYNRPAIYLHENMICEKQIIIRYINYHVYFIYCDKSAKNEIFIKLMFLVKKTSKNRKAQDLSRI